MSTRFYTSFATAVRAIRRFPLYLILLVGLIQGLLYVFLIPPWWHFDEPGHFEFAWQIANLGHWPQNNEVSEPMRLKLAESLLRYHFYDLVGYQPVLDGSEPVDIPYAPQTTKHPLYYIVASIPLRLLGNIDFAIQDRILRLLSLGMFLLTLWAAWKALGEILPKNHPVQWMTVLFLALLPGFSDTMTSVNDDVGAILAFSLFLWASLRLLNRGMSLWGSLGVLVSATLCYWTKNTAWPALGLTPIVFLLAILRGKWSWIAWTITAVGLVGGFLIFLRWDDPDLWYRGSRQAQDIRIETSVTPLGNYVISLHNQPGKTIKIGQFISISQITSLRHKSVTLGGWIWADRPVAIQLPTLRVTLHGSSEAPSLITLFDSLDSETRQFLSDSTCSACMGQIKASLEEKAEAEPWVTSPSQTVSLSTSPTFYSTTFQLTPDAESGWVELIPFPLADEPSEATIYYDGLVMIEGKRMGAPEFDSPPAQSGTWDGKPFNNLLRNASAETTWAALSPIGEKFLDRVFTTGTPSVFIASLQDWQGTQQYYRGIASNLLETFWAKPAIAKVSLLGGTVPYQILQWITVLGLASALVLILRKFRDMPWSILLFLGLTVAGVWALTVARGGIETIKPYGLLPWARYSFPAAIPTALLLCAGWWKGMRWLGGWVKISPRGQALVFIAFLVSVDILAMLSITRFFYWKNEQEFLFLFVIILIAAYFGVRALDQNSPSTIENEKVQKI